VHTGLMQWLVLRNRSTCTYQTRC